MAVQFNKARYLAQLMQISHRKIGLEHLYSHPSHISPLIEDSQFKSNLVGLLACNVRLGYWLRSGTDKFLQKERALSMNAQYKPTPPLL